MRYTKKEEDFDFDDNNKIYYFDEYIVPEHSKIYDAIDKLGQLEDIEEELGIDLITLFKALNNPIYIKENYDGTLIDKTLWCSNCIICGIGEPIIKVDEYGVYPKDYGETWALTKDELL